MHKKKKWNILCQPEDLHLFKEIQKKRYKKRGTLKKNHRSKVRVVKIGDQKYVLKIPREKNKKKWIRFTTLFRDGEAFKNIKGMLTYQKIGIPSTKPVMAAEKRQKGMVVDSWLLYEYLDGQPCLDNEPLYPRVIDKLQQIHNKGYLHGDSQIRNFLYEAEEDEVYVIDSNPKPAGLFNFSKAYEFAYLRKSAPGIEKYFGAINDWWLYKLAYYYDIYERKFVRNRRKLKKLIGLSR
ncbi:hypothetical protein LVD15_10445 [Fulvivirga maritima]|uniref:lipopolysaccharide kinase InaA family protein n=1 Tax=Fulvivirga maritima TaxID=2904247 RepID=UPI001F30FBB2|nr:lipopolysaccharide kinase InaA family protein [Fulvivirga maritima]UII28818.1 hypothetical protein LVD15_10445 [Fulvivirga maritima]